MRTTIIFAHPWHGSYNRAILDKVIGKLREKGEEFILIDLYRDGFDPVMNEEDMRLYAEGQSGDPHVRKYNDILDRTERVIVIFPIWWYDMPAMMRGFFDKVMLNGSAWYADDKGMHAIRNIHETIVITTSSSPTDDLINLYGNPVIDTIINSTFRFIGFNNAIWYNLGKIDSTTHEEREEYLEMISTAV